MNKDAEIQSIRSAVLAFLEYHKPHLTAKAGLDHNRAAIANLNEDQSKVGQVSPWLADHVRKTLREGPKLAGRGQKAYALWLRDSYIAEAVHLAMQMANNRAKELKLECPVLEETKNR